MAHPNTFRTNVMDRARKAMRRSIERAELTDADLDAAFDDYPTDDYNSFFGACREAGHATERCGALWAVLKERGRVPTGEPPSDMNPNDDIQTATGTTSDEGIGREPVSSAPETVDDLEAQFREADQVYLITTDGCPSCAQAKEALADWIDTGMVQVENIQHSDLAADIVIDLNIEGTPTLVMENDGVRTEI